MKKYNKTQRCQGGLVYEGDKIVQLPDNHIFWNRVPKGKKLSYDENDLPILVDIIIDYKALKWNETKVIREQKRLADLEYGGGVFQMDSLSRENLQDQLSAGLTTQWRLTDNTVLELTPEDVQAILTAYAERKLFLYSKSWEVEAEINGSENPSELDVAQLFESKLS
mgnify:CR=1 FL=1